MLDDVFQAGTDAVIRDSLQRPMTPRVQAPKFSLWGALGAAAGGIPRGAAEMGASAIDLMSGLSKVDVSAETMAASMTPEGRAEMQRRAKDTLETGFRDNEVARSLRAASDYYMPDAATSHGAEIVASDFLRVATKAIGSAVALGPIPGAILAGAEEGFTQSDKLAAQGVDVETRTKVGAVTGVVTAAGFALPVAGKTWAQTIGLAAAGGPVSFVGQNAVSRAILEDADYTKQAQQFDPFDPVGLTLSTLLPLGFGALAMRGAKGRVPVEAEDAARVTLLRESVDASRTVPAADLAGSVRHEQALTKALDQLAAGERVDVSDVAGVRAFESLESFLAREKVKPEALPPEVPGDFYAWLRSVGGIDIAQKFDIGGDANNVRGNPAGIFRKGGNPTDTLVDMAEQAGYLRPGATSGDLVDLVQTALRGEPVRTFDQQMAAAARGQAEDSMRARLEAVEGRLKLLGIDTTPAQGNVAALEAYARQNEPAILRAALDDARSAVDDVAPELGLMQERAQQIARDIEDGGRTLEQFEREVGTLSPVMRRMVGEQLQPRTDAPRQAPDAQSVGNPRDLVAETVALRKQQSVLTKLLECLNG
jgi:hypothetical protein